jgi:argininosuccinate lyase
MHKKPWQGRFSEETDRSVEAFTSSISVDKRLYPHDIRGSIAHCRMLAKVGIITDEEAGQLINGLKEIKSELDCGTFKFDDSLEDIHMHIEMRLLEKVGKVAQKLHTARSRNDQVILDVRMYLRSETKRIIRQLRTLRSKIVVFAKANLNVVVPGYTHIQRAQPVLLSHHFMAYYEMFTRDSQRFCDALARICVMPLGAAALAGTTYPIDRAYTAKLLDFDRISNNSMDAVSDRDFMLEFLSAASICMVHFSRISEEFVLWSSLEFGFIQMPDAFATGSSIMPQKKNPDVAELVRGRSGHVFGDLISLLTMMKSLPLSYNRDMQEDKTPLFRSVDILSACIDIYTRLLPKIIVNKERMRAAASTGFLNATDMADYLVKRGMPFRKAHSCVGKIVGDALLQKKELHELSLDELKAYSGLIEEDVFDHLTLEYTIDRRISAGGTASKNVKTAIKEAETQLAQEG